LHGIDPRLEIFADEKLNMSAAFSVRDIRADGMPDPPIGPAAVEHFADQRECALSNEFVRPVNSPVLVQDELAQTGKDRLLPAEGGKLRQEIMKRDFSHRPKVPVCERELDRASRIVRGTRRARSKGDPRRHRGQERFNPLALLRPVKDVRVKRSGDTQGLERCAQMLGCGALPYREMIGLFPRLFDENELAHLAKHAILAFEQNVEPEVRVEYRHLQPMTFGASPVERIHRVVGGAAPHPVEPSYEGFGTAARELLIQDAQALVVAFATDPIDERRCVFELTKGRASHATALRHTV
jgi:hypothetical protein